MLFRNCPGSCASRVRTVMKLHWKAIWPTGPDAVTSSHASSASSGTASYISHPSIQVCSQLLSTSHNSFCLLTTLLDYPDRSQHLTDMGTYQAAWGTPPPPSQAWGTPPPRSIDAWGNTINPAAPGNAWGQQPQAYPPYPLSILSLSSTLPRTRSNSMADTRTSPPNTANTLPSQPHPYTRPHSRRGRRT